MEEKTDNSKNAVQIFSPKLYLIAIVVGVSLGTSILSNLFFGAKTEAEVWRKTSIQAIVEVNQAAIANQKQAEVQKRVSEFLEKFKADLEALNDLKVDEVLGKYFKGK